ncbi:CRISP-associated protein Cas1 [Parafrankia irregularis]|uniref:CRISPR-associated endonuclease Cas1 n=1 Tax=Parafrankia irregularis TaxID=795642 RepID=A0A0S4QLY6_9ACTN|nr:MULTISPECIES: type I-E CRISPR-associated endonuclease Cas1e [Parafrankia]MBE3200223.1 type I-E CRISPR-associated endonuclease Cas1 [Parafrankia sp. CH37]CUU56583.1 CRISP-associated protein Cas1 [Parafrankia irregularis]
MSVTRAPQTAKHRLGRPTLAMLPRVADSLSFLYLESVRITQDDTGILGYVEKPDGIEKVYLPTAALSCLLLGPGTSITQPALATLARHDTSVVCVGAGGIRSYANIQPAGLTTRWLEQQARTWADDSLRVQVAARMYRTRFAVDVPESTTLAQLRGMEGQRVKAYYKLLAQKHRIPRFRRNYDPAKWDTQDPVNLALSAANTCLYGIVHAAVCALGCSPALGYIHSGTQLAFVYDIADLYKAKTTIPLAFALHDSPDPERAARSRLREEFRLIRLLPNIINDIQNMLDLSRDLDTDDDPGDRASLAVDMVHLWDPDLGALPAGVNYSNDIPAAGDDIPGLSPPAGTLDNGDIEDDDVLINLGNPWPQ